MTTPTHQENESPEEFFDSLMQLDYDEINKIKRRDDAIASEAKEEGIVEGMKLAMTIMQKLKNPFGDTTQVDQNFGVGWLRKTATKEIQQAITERKERK